VPQSPAKVLFKTPTPATPHLTSSVHTSLKHLPPHHPHTSLRCRIVLGSNTTTRDPQVVHGDRAVISQRPRGPPHRNPVAYARRPAMSNTHTLERSNQTGFSDSTTSSLSSAERLDFDPADNRPILCYQYRGKLETLPRKDLCARLDKGTPHPPHKPPTTPPSAMTTDTPAPADESLRCTLKLIPRGTSYIDVKRHDLFLAEEKHAYEDFPNYDASLASIKVPLLAWLSRMVWGNYDELYILSYDSSPRSSERDEDSRRVSPTSSWGEGSDGSVGVGATE